MGKNFDELTSNINEIHDIIHSAALLNWDQETYMPKKGINDRANQLSSLTKIAHKKFTSNYIGQLVEDSKSELKNTDSDSKSNCLLKVIERDYQKNTKVPSELVTEISKATSLGQQKWAQAKQNSDFSIFKPYLKNIINLKTEYAKSFSPYEHIYDPLLDDFEPGFKTKTLKTLFKQLKSSQLELIEKILSSSPINNSFLYQEFEDNKQFEFATSIISRMGYDWGRGRIDRAEHPFTINPGIDDVRITTKFNKNYLPIGMFSTMHEAGHALYEQGIPYDFYRTPLASGASLALHESQSRLWENIIGHSFSFWKYFFPKLKKSFPQNLSNVSLEDFYKGINKVSPSLIRVEADEVTYNMHIMIRFELEIALLEGKIEVKDLPELWNNKMEKYFNKSPNNDSEGILQDIHWSLGAIGYFPTYTIGNLISAQLWDCICRDIPEVYTKMNQGQFEDILGWLRENIHNHGAKFKPQELVQRVTDSKISPQPYINYLNRKYSDIYNL